MCLHLSVKPVYDEKGRLVTEVFRCVECGILLNINDLINK